MPALDLVDSRLQLHWAVQMLGAGMTPGDGTYPEPYWYVTPWPYPGAPELPPLPTGATWHTEGWIRAVLRGAGRDLNREALFLHRRTRRCSHECTKRD